MIIFCRLWLVFKLKHHWLYLGSIWLSVGFAILILGCSLDEIETAQTAMELVLPTEAEGRANIAHIRVLIQSDQRIIPAQQFKLTPTSDTDGFQDINIFIPLDAKHIRVEALGSLGGLLFVGESTVEIQNEKASKIRIQLDPTTPVIKFKNVPSFVDVGQDFQIEMVLKHVKYLFALTLEISYPNVFIEPYAVDLGDFWQNTDDESPVLLISDHNLTSKTPGRLSLGLVRTRPPDGEMESGKIVTISFHTKQTGVAIIRVLDSPRLVAQKLDGQPIDNFDDLTRYLNRAQAQLEIR